MLCQPAWSTSTPPSIGPRISDSAVNDDQPPITRARLAGSGNACASSESAPGIISAPATPCTARPASSMKRSPAIAHIAEPSVNTITPASQARLRP